MEWVVLYTLFALTTSITSIYELLHPVITKRINEAGHVNDKILIYITFFLLGIISAPLLLVSCLVPSVGIVFREHLYTALFPEE